MYLPLWLVVPALSLILICSMHVVSGTREALLTASIVRFVQACTSVLHPFVIISSFQINRHTLRWNDSTMRGVGETETLARTNGVALVLS